MEAELVEVEVVDGEIVRADEPEQALARISPPVQAAVAAAAGFAAGAATFALLRRYGRSSVPEQPLEYDRGLRPGRYIVLIRPLN